MRRGGTRAAEVLNAGNGPAARTVVRPVPVARPWLRGVLRCGLLLVAASLVVVPVAGTSFAAGTPVGGSADVLTQTERTLQPILDNLHATYEKAEAATQKYDQLAEQLSQAQTDETELQVGVANAQSSVDAGTAVAGQLAAAQYRNGSLSQLGELIFAKNPQAAQHTEALLSMAGKSQARFVAQLKADQSQLAQARSAATLAKQHAAALVAAQGAARTAVNKQLDLVRRQVSTLTGVQQQELSLLEQKDANAAQTALLASGVLGKGSRHPSVDGAAAVAYAFQQLGAEYVWGGVGPYAQGFDCSGLTSQAWLHAGVPIPRTSEEQWAQLPHVPLDALRPGDLIVYFSGASHIAIYIGGGLVIEAPHTGAVVYVAPIATDPILGAVRPDPNAPSLGSYRPPTIPKGAQGPQPIGPGPVNHPSPPVKATPKPKPTPTSKPSSRPPVKPSMPPTIKPSAPLSPSASPTGTPSGGPSATPSTSATSSASSSPSTADVVVGGLPGPDGQ